ncbi:MAG: hypothetical protein HZA19_06335 [Nitrospirae bacterium]|nr:hypothetical protein [Nitrospirota bacterium]
MLSASVAPADDVEKAYSLNQEAMVDMSMAEFGSAAGKFLEAAALVPDYQIQGRKLRYTPTFMAAWAFEKDGLREEACRYYEQFLRIAPEALREATKVEHAQDFLENQCP